MEFQMTAPLEVGIACRDLPSLRRFYEELLDFKFVSEFVVSAEKSAAAAMSADGYTVVRLQTSFGERVKLLAPNVPVATNPSPAYILDRPNGIYLTFIVADISAAIKRLRQAGTEFMTGNERVEVRPGVYLAFCRDPEGNILELVQYEDIASYRPDLQKRND